MTRTRLAVLLSATLAAACLAGCSKPQPAASAETAPAPAAETAPPEASPDAFRFRIGGLEAFALKDGEFEIANDGKILGVGQPTEQVAALLTDAGQPGDVLHLSLQPLLVRDGERVLLFDTGAADAFPGAGRLPASMRAAGVEPTQVTDVFISHLHSDHVGGLRTGAGALAFPNATVHLSAPEWEAMKADASAADLVTAITPKVMPFQPGAAIVPGVVTAVAVDGHTPGHSAYEIASEGERLLYIGDTAHHHVVSVQRPEWTIQFDGDAPLAQASRRALLQRAADEGLRLYAVHFPYPGLGRVEVRDDSFVWVPEQ